MMTIWVNCSFCSMVRRKISLWVSLRTWPNVLDHLTQDYIKTGPHAKLGLPWGAVWPARCYHNNQCFPRPQYHHCPSHIHFLFTGTCSYTKFTWAGLTQLYHLWKHIYQSILTFDTTISHNIIIICLQLSRSPFCHQKAQSRQSMDCSEVLLWYLASKCYQHIL